MAAPKAKKPTGKGTPPTTGTGAPAISRNTSSAEAGELVPMNFKVPAEFHHDFKVMATMHKITMVDLLKEAFALYKDSKGG